MLNLISLLASGSGGVGDLADTVYDQFINVVHIVMPTILSIVLVFGVIYGIVLGINFAKAEDAEGRDKAKGKLINMIIGVLVMLVIISVVYAVLSSGWVKKFFDGKNFEPGA